MPSQHHPEGTDILMKMLGRDEIGGFSMTLFRHLTDTLTPLAVFSLQAVSVSAISMSHLVHVLNEWYRNQKDNRKPVEKFHAEHREKAYCV